MELEAAGQKNRAKSKGCGAESAKVGVEMKQTWLDKLLDFLEALTCNMPEWYDPEEH